MEILKRIEDTYPKMTRKQKKIADYMVSHAENMAFITLRELSREVEITEITILNMCKALGYESFNEVKYEFRKYINRGRVEFFDDNDYYNTNIPKYELDEKETGCRFVDEFGCTPSGTCMGSLGRVQSRKRHAGRPCCRLQRR